ncbi:MAG: hypothetical protein R3212_04040 [Xanthomonadales bacterium]|nr:hypothetical protein [Xanthomonadales bacterium]
MSWIRRYVCRPALLVVVLALMLPGHVSGVAAEISPASDHHSADLSVEHPSALPVDAVSSHEGGDMSSDHLHVSVCESGHCCTFIPMAVAPGWQGNHDYTLAARSLVYLHNHQIDLPPPKRA